MSDQSAAHSASVAKGIEVEAMMRQLGIKLFSAKPSFVEHFSGNYNYRSLTHRELELTWGTFSTDHDAYFFICLAVQDEDESTQYANLSYYAGIDQYDYVVGPTNLIPSLATDENCHLGRSEVMTTIVKENIVPSSDGLVNLGELILKSMLEAFAANK